MVFALLVLNFPVGGLFSPQFQNAPWSWAKLVDFVKHVWIAVIVIGTAGTAGIPTAGPLLYTALRNEDIYLSGSILMVLAVFLLIGNLLADIALAWFDPRIRYD